jgi:hypothetical protein
MDDQRTDRESRGLTEDERGCLYGFIIVAVIFIAAFFGFMALLRTSIERAMNDFDRAVSDAPPQK